MNLDTRSLLAATFMRARHAATSLPDALDVACPLADLVDQTGRLDVEAPQDLSMFDPVELVFTPDPIHLTERRVFDVIRQALHDLRRLAAANEELALRNLGYAFHRLPELHEPFERNLYAFSLRFVAFHWALLSAELKLALAHLLDLTPEALEARVIAPGFASSMFTSP